MMRDLRGDIDRVRPALERIEKIGEALPLPDQSIVEHDAGNLLDAFHQLHQRAAMLRANGSEADAAIAEHRGRHAVPARRTEQRVPHRLPVVMGVHVDPAGRHQQSRGVDLAPSRALLATDFSDALARDGHVAGKRRPAGTIDNGTAANDDVVHRSLLEPWKPNMTYLPQTRCNARALTHSTTLAFAGTSGVSPFTPLIPA
jgi:hypothetical protein